ncbi:MAG: cation:dicarboxylase symporter family transporter [Mycoplasmataceae bacterium]|nr:cation:dicarboxylase symporter family transporter [Mycoplasmataceae bacterium]
MKAKSCLIITFQWRLFSRRRMMNNIIDEIKNYSIDPNSIGHLFGLATWQSGLAFVFLLFSIGIVIFFTRKYNKRKALLVGIVTGLFGLIIFGIIYQYSAPTDNIITIIHERGNLTWIDETKTWLSMPSEIFIDLISLIIPLYVFTALVLLINNKKGDIKKTKSVFTSSIIGLIILPLIGIFVAFMFIPIIKLFPEGMIPVSNETIDIDGNTSIPIIINQLVPYSLIIFTDPAFLGSVVIFAILIGVTIRGMEKNHQQKHDEVVYFFETLKIVNSKYISYVILMIPLVIATRIPFLGLTNNLDQVKFIGWYLVIFIAGATLIMMILVSIILMFSNRNGKALINHWGSSLGNPSLASMLPITENTVKNLGTCDEVSQITPTLGTSMGLVMCGGFTPTIIALLTANNYGSSQVEITIGLILLIFIYVFIASLGTSGVGHADSLIILGVLGTLGFGPEIYLTILVISPITEFIAVLVNSTGHIATAIVVEKIHKKDKGHLNTKNN